MTFGDQAEHLEEMADEDPTRIPAALLSQPEIPDHLAGAIEAFNHLSRARRCSMTIAGTVAHPIEIKDAFAMAEAIGWPPLDFFRVITPADALYVERINQRNLK